MGGFKSEITKNAEKQINKKKETKMKNIKENTTVKTIVTVTLTLAFVAYSFGLIYLGTQYEHGINTRVTSEAKSLTAAVKPSKQ